MEGKQLLKKKKTLRKMINKNINKVVFTLSLQILVIYIMSYATEYFQIVLLQHHFENNH